jgi:Transcriptional Coactivator p15 (PC4)
MTAQRPTLDEPITIARFWKTRWRTESVHVELAAYEGHNLISVRVYRTDAGGCDRPTTKGVSLAVARLPELAAAVQKALAKAKELNLIGDDGGGK